MTPNCFAIFALLLAPIAASADDELKTLNFQNGMTRITAHYSVRELDSSTPSPTPGRPESWSNEVLATPFFFQVRRHVDRTLTYKDRVHFMLIQYAKTCFNGTCEDKQLSEEGDLQFTIPGQFSGYAKLPITISQSQFDGYALRVFQNIHQELVIWINDEIVKNPETGANFTFVLTGPDTSIVQH